MLQVVRLRTSQFQECSTLAAVPGTASKKSRNAASLSVACLCASAARLSKRKYFCTSLNLLLDLLAVNTGRPSLEHQRD